MVSRYVLLGSPCFIPVAKGAVSIFGGRVNDYSSFRVCPHNGVSLGVGADAIAVMKLLRLQLDEHLAKGVLLPGGHSLTRAREAENHGRILLLKVPLEKRTAGRTLAPCGLFIFEVLPLSNFGQYLISEWV
jgi:hypothetical protein